MEKTFRPAILLFYRFCVLVSFYTGVLFFAVAVRFSNHYYPLAVFIILFSILTWKLPTICKLNNKWLFLIIIILAQIPLITGTTTYMFDDFIKSYITLSLFLVLCFFGLLLNVYGYGGDTKKIQIDLKSEKLKRPINNISDIENIVLKLSPYSVTMSRVDSMVQVKVLDTVSDEWIDVTVKLENGILEVTQKEKMLKAICYQLLDKVRANVIIELGASINTENDTSIN